MTNEKVKDFCTHNNISEEWLIQMIMDKSGMDKTWASDVIDNVFADYQEVTPRDMIQLIIALKSDLKQY